MAHISRAQSLPGSPQPDYCTTQCSEGVTPHCTAQYSTSAAKQSHWEYSELGGTKLHVSVLEVPGVGYGAVAHPLDDGLPLHADDQHLPLVPHGREDAAVGVVHLVDCLDPVIGLVKIVIIESDGSPACLQRGRQ